MPTTTKSDRIRSLLARLRPAAVTPPAEPDPVERFKDGTPKDRIVALSEKLDTERALKDPRYYEANRDEILELRRLEQDRGAQEQSAQYQQSRRAAAERGQAERIARIAAEAAQRETQEREHLEHAGNGWVKPENG